MFAKLRGISALRRSINDKLIEKWKPKNAMSTAERCERKADEAKNCCQVKCLMDEMTSPEGSWSENYKRENARRNRILFSSLFVFICSAIAMKNTDLAKGYPEVTFFYEK